MRNSNGRQNFAPVGPKESWHPYGLQSLRPEQFISVVNRIIRGENRLLPVRHGRAGLEPGVYTPLFGD
jgi:hypothetical protein